MKIRINQDVTFNWKLTVEGESVDLSKLELSVEITTPSNKKVEIIPTIKFDTLEFNYRPKQVGEYILSAYLNRFKDGETALDIKAFEGVRYSWNQDFSTDGNLEDNYVELVGDFNVGPKLDIYTNITYTELVNLRNNAQLTPGKLYRITDYTCTTSQPDTQAAVNRFDIIVTADSESVLNEEARAIQHAGDYYFANNDLNAWKIWYCLDNDLARFSWADAVVTAIELNDNQITCTYAGTTVINGTTYYLWEGDESVLGGSYAATIVRNPDPNDNDEYQTLEISADKTTIVQEWLDNIRRVFYSGNGKGVIYRMIDEFNNDVPYDFKNIQFKHPKDTTTYPDYYYTFANPEFGNDLSVDIGYKCYSNIIMEYYVGYKRKLNCIIFIGDNCYNNTFNVNCYNNAFGPRCYNNNFGYGCYGNTLKSNSTSNTFGDNCYNNTFGSSCKDNTFGNNCYSNIFGNSCYNNTFGNSCFSNSLDNSCSDNSFGVGCYSNSLGNGCNYNSFGNGCYSNSLTSNCYSNSFGERCYSNSFGNACNSNSFGNGCNSNSFDSDCYYNSFENYCSYNSLGINCLFNSFDNGCSYIKFASDSSATTKYGYYQNNHFGDGCEYIVFTGAENVANASEIHNYTFAQGLQGTADNYLIVEGKRNRVYETYISKGTDGTIKESIIAEKQDKLVAGENIKIENNVISAIVGGTTDVTKLSVKITWAELKALVDNSKLVAGQQYRITDYTCTTTQAATKSAGHVFDIIVTADDESTLNDIARAVKHDGDEYFANSDLNAWKIWYCIDNDTNRFAWADSANGKGVIYRMIDDLNNDIPYDFKNIQFYRQWDEAKQLWCTIPDGNTGVPCYTFSSDGDSSTVEFTDMSLSISNNVYSNVIKEYINIGKQTLNNICFFGRNCYRNSFGSYCYFNSFGTGCDTNTFGCRCNTNSFGYGCSFNTFGNKFEHNSLGTYCLNNSFGNDCSYNSLDDTCFGNSFGNMCVYNSIGESCSCNSFGNGCSYIKFASDSSATTKYGYYQNNHFGDGCEYIVFKGGENASGVSELHNYNFAQGLQGTADNYLIVEGKQNRKYETKVAKNSAGDLKIYCEADLIQ